MWLCREKIEKSKLPAFVCSEVGWLLGGKYKCVFSDVRAFKSGDTVDKVAFFLYFCADKAKSHKLILPALE